jgi:hypothetical protein
MWFYGQSCILINIKKMKKKIDGMRMTRASKSPHYVQAECATTYNGKKLSSLVFFKSSW